MEKLAIGIDLGGTYIKALLMDEQGRILQKCQEPIIDSIAILGEQWKNAIKELIRKLKKEAHQESLAVGIAAPGLPNEQNTSIAYMPGRLSGLENFDWSGFLDEPEIKIINDAHAALLAESKIGAGKGFDNLVMITLGTGVGGGIIINGKIYQGKGQRAGHLGHISLDSNGPIGITGIPGGLEEAIGNASIEKRTLGKYKSTAHLVMDYEKREPFATWVWLESIRKLALGLASYCNILSPEKIIIGGGICKAGEHLFKPLAEFMDCYEWRPGGLKIPIEKAKCDEFAGAVGAAFNALNLINQKSKN